MSLTYYLMPDRSDITTRTQVSPALICRPLLSNAKDEDEIPLVDFGGQDLIRCNSCLGYMNPMITWISAGRKWRCNLCQTVNDTPGWYLSSPVKNCISNKGVFDIVAPDKYQQKYGKQNKITYFFVIDGTKAALDSGFTKSTCDSISSIIENLFITNEPTNDCETSVGFLTYASKVYFHDVFENRVFTMNSVDDPFACVSQEKILINISEGKDNLNMLCDYIDKLPKLMRDLTENNANNCCFGAAVQLAAEIIGGEGGGRAYCFQSMRPTVGVGTLPDRTSAKFEPKINLMEHHF
eukprot:UN31080